MRAPSCEDLMNEDGFKEIERAFDDSWRHGVHVREVQFREEDETFWMAEYQVSTDGETHGLRDGDATITQVYPHTVSVVKYSATPPEHKL